MDIVETDDRSAGREVGGSFERPVSRLARLLVPRSLALIGGHPAETAIEQCRRLGFGGDLWAVHPTRSEMAGVPCVPTVEDLPAAPDAAMVAEIKRLEATPCYFMAPMRKTPTERAMEQIEKERKEALAADY